MERLLEYNRKDLRAAVGDEVAARFFDQRQRYPSPYNDLDYWMKNIKATGSSKELVDYMDTFKSKNQKDKEVRVEGAEKVYDDGRWKIYLIKTYEAMTQYGKGTKWCIAGNFPGYIGRGKQFFDSYRYPNGKYLNYYVYIDSEAPADDNKWCVCQLHDEPERAEIWCAKDYEIGGILDGAPSVKGLPNVSAVVIVDGVLKEVKKRGIHYEIPSEVTAIGEYAFAHKNFRSITFAEPCNVKTIAKGAFWDAAIDTSDGLKIPDSVEALGNGVFMNLSARTLTLGRGITSLPKFTCALTDSQAIFIEGKIDNISDEWLIDPVDNLEVVFDTKNNEKLLNWIKEYNITGVDINTAKFVNKEDKDTKRKDPFGDRIANIEDEEEQSSGFDANLWNQ